MVEQLQVSPELPCPACGRPVESWECVPGYVLTADFYPGLPLVGIPGTERRVRVVGANGPEWTLHPCGDQFYELKFEARDGVITKIIAEEVERRVGLPDRVFSKGPIRFEGGPLDGLEMP